MNIIFGGGCLILGVLSFLMSFYVAEKVSNTVISKALQYLGITLFFYRNGDVLDDFLVR